MKIYTDTPEGVTVVKNTFIDQYMPQANGEFVKVYLYLLRCANTGRELSLSSIADVLEHTENDIRRALLYWEKQDLVHLKMNTHGDLISITFSDLPTTQEEAATRSRPVAHIGCYSCFPGAWTRDRAHDRIRRSDRSTPEGSSRCKRAGACRRNEPGAARGA